MVPFRQRIFENAGFTVLELIVVIGIIALLSAFILASIQSSRERAFDAQRVSTLRSVQNAVELFYSKNGYYPYGIAFSVWSGPVSKGGCNPVPSVNWQNCDFSDPMQTHGDPMGDLIRDGDLPNGLPVDQESALVGYPGTPYLANSASRGIIYCSGNPRGNCPAYPTTKTYVLGTNLSNVGNLPADPTWGNFQLTNP